MNHPGRPTSGQSRDASRLADYLKECAVDRLHGDWPVMRKIFVGHARLIAVVVLSFLSLLFMVLLRYTLAGRFAQSYLLWNLALAAVPVGIAAWGYQLVEKARTRRFALAACFGSFFLWMLFFPNAPYIFTDFIHVIRRANLGSISASWMSPLDLLWFDIVMNAAFAFVGHYLGLISMYLMHSSLRRLLGRISGSLLMLPPMLLSGFGIHLGRFSRFNSWDLFFHPLSATRAILETLAQPSAILFSLAFSFFIGVTYLIFFLVRKDSSWD